MRHAFFAFVLVFSLSAMVFAQVQKVKIVVHVPAQPVEGDAIYLAGSLPQVGGWKEDGVTLVKQNDGAYSADIDLPIDQTLEYKINRGSWDTVEKTESGGERDNRSIKITPDLTLIDIKVERWADDPAITQKQKTSTVVGTLKIETVESKFLSAKRTIRIWLPENYQSQPEEKFAVLYMHDGQNCFDRATSAFGNEWEIDETMTRLIKENAIPPMIVVGIDNGQTERINEMLYQTDPILKAGGKADQYARFLIEEVKPLIEKKYRVKTGKENTYLGGSSLGGLVSLEIARRNPNLFSGVIAMSPSISRLGQPLIDDLSKDAGGLAAARVWIDMGTHETMASEAGESPEAQNQRFISGIKRLDEVMTQQKIEHKLVIAENAVHNETYWAKRFPDAIKYIVNK